MTRFQAVSCVVAMLAIIGCTTGPDYVRPNRAMSDKWSSPRQGGETDSPVSIAEWWTTLNDQTLNDLIRRGIEANLDLRVASTRVREARAARGIAASALWPTLNASGSYSRSQMAKPEAQAGGPSVTVGGVAGATGFTPNISVRGNNASVSRSGIGNAAVTSVGITPGGQGGVDRQNDLFQAGFDARWEFDLFGGNRRAVEAANADIQATEESRRDMFVSLISEVALNYIELRAGQNRLDILHSNIDAQTKSENITRDRFKAGLSSELDAVRAHALLTSTQSQVPRIEAQIEASIHRLSVLLGQDPGALDTELSATAPLPTPPAVVPVGLPSDLLRRRPDIRQAERQLAAATARVGVATADLFPKFSLTGSIAGQNDTLSSLLSGSNRIWSFGPAVSWPIFDAGRIRGNIEVQRSRQERAALVYEQSILLALEDVENGLVSFAKEQERRESLQEAVATNQKAVRIANERYTRGLEGFLNALQAQQELLNAQDQFVQSQSFVLTDLVSLYKALGGGWEMNEPVPAIAEEVPAAASTNP